MKTDSLITQIEKLYDQTGNGPSVEAIVDQFLDLLDRGEVRSAEPSSESPAGWRVNAWAKKGILLAFRVGKFVKVGNDRTDGDHGTFRFFDKHTLPVKRMSTTDGIRVVPGGTSVRRGAHIAAGVVIMPPSYVNVGAYVDQDTMLDSHSLVGSCAQVGKRVHISAGTQIGGVLEPVGAMPVIIEDEVMVGGNCGIYEGAVVKRRAVIGAGCIITGSTPVYDLVKKKIYRKEKGTPLEIPEGAVVVPGSRIAGGDFAAGNMISLYTPVIVKYRDEKTDAATVLEEGLR